MLLERDLECPCYTARNIIVLLDSEHHTKLSLPCHPQMSNDGVALLIVAVASFKL